MKKIKITLLFILLSIKTFTQTVYYDDATELYGIIDRYGKEILKPTYKYMSSIENGLCVFEFNNKYGILNEKGIVVLKPIFNNQYQIQCDAGKINEGMIPVREFGSETNDFKAKLGFYNTSGVLKIPYKFEYASGFCNGIACVSLDYNKYNFINTSGEYLSGIWFEEFRRISGVYYGMTNNDEGVLNFYQININKKIELSQNQSNISELFNLNRGVIEECNNNSNNLIRFFYENGLVGLKNERGEVIIYPKYDKVYDFNDNRALAFIKDIGYIINEKGDIICNLSEKIPKFNFRSLGLTFLDERCFSFKNGLLHAETSETKWVGEEKTVTHDYYLIDINGNIIKRVSIIPDYLFADCEGDGDNR